jgi:transcriptional antiterminator RfaH
MPVFPGYIFVNLDLERDRWHSVNGTIGVGYLIASGDRPTPVPLGVVEALKVGFDKSNLREEPPAFTVGDKVELTTGPFANMVGELLETSSGGRVKILLEVMGRETPTWTVASGVLPAA